jgi:hypothetical protein
MFKFYRLLAALWARLASEQCPADPTENFTARDWADLPPYHPRAERDC